MLSVRRSDRLGLFTNVLVFLAMVLLANSFILAINPTEMSPSRPSLVTPPGYVIGIVWVWLFLSMAVARWLLLRSMSSTRGQLTGLWMFAICCALYPVYTSGLHSLRVGLIANIVLLLASIVLIFLVWRISRWAAWWLMPIVLWLSYATLATYQQIVDGAQ